MEHCHPSATTPRAGIDPAAASADPLDTCAASRAARPRRSTADYRWTQPKVIAFLDALAQCGKVAEAARVVGMSSTSAYRLRLSMASARFDAAFEGARRSIAAMIARERALTQSASPAAQGDAVPAQGASPATQGAGSPPQGDGAIPQGAAFSRKVPAKCAR